MAIDGSKFKAVNNRDKNFTDRKLQARMEQLEESIGCYLEELERADREPTAVSEGRVARLTERIVGLQEQMHQLKEIGVEMQAAPDGQVSLTDPDARSMATSGRGTGSLSEILCVRHNMCERSMYAEQEQQEESGGRTAADSERND